MKPAAILLWLAAVGLIQPATAADAAGQFGVRGAGLISCALYTEQRSTRSEAYHTVAGWLDGYITGVNEYAADTYDTTSFESTELLLALLGEHCSRHPETPLFAVIRPLIKGLSEHRLREPSDRITFTIDGRELRLYAEVIRRIQHRLSEAGFYSGKTHGVYTDAVRQAMREYQASLELNPTGIPDQLTLWRLFNDPG